jgi:hypothetical protein
MDGLFGGVNGTRSAIHISGQTEIQHGTFAELNVGNLQWLALG